jgi:serine/threonine/tyrosine-interacting protein
MKLDFPSPLQCNKDTEESSYFMRRKMWEFYLAVKSKPPVLQKQGIAHVVCIQPNVEANINQIFNNYVVFRSRYYR